MYLSCYLFFILRNNLTVTNVALSLTDLQDSYG